MTSHCANPNCATPLLGLREGRIFQFEVRPQFTAGTTSGTRAMVEKIRQVSHFWLCGRCSSKLTLAFDALKGVIVTPFRAS